MIFISVLAVILLIIDQASKMLIAGHFNHTIQGNPLEGIPIIEDVLYFTYSHNKGAAFGILGDGEWIPFFIILTIVACGAFVWWLIKQPNKHWLLKVSSALMLSGAVGNLIDRAFIGKVRDFIYVNIPFATFNFADSCLVVGTIVMAIYILFLHEKHTSGNVKTVTEAAVDEQAEEPTVDQKQEDNDEI